MVSTLLMHIIMQESLMPNSDNKNSCLSMPAGPFSEFNALLLFFETWSVVVIQSLFESLAYSSQREEGFACGTVNIIHRFFPLTACCRGRICLFEVSHLHARLSLVLCPFLCQRHSAPLYEWIFSFAFFYYVRLET